MIRNDDDWERGGTEGGLGWPTLLCSVPPPPGGRFLLLREEIALDSVSHVEIYMRAVVSHYINAIVHAGEGERLM